MSAFEEICYRRPDSSTQNEIPRAWVCRATRTCMQAGALDGRECPRGADHRTLQVRYLDLARAREETTV